MSAAASQRPGRWKVIAAVAIVVVGLSSVAAYVLLRNVPVTYTEPNERFKYGSFGSEGDSMPFAIWEALPDVCSAKLPGGYASLGMIYEAGREQPIGVSRRQVGGMDRMGYNCAVCHVGAVKDSPGAPLQPVIGMPNHRLDFVRYVKFVLDCVGDQAFEPDNVIAAMRRHRPVSFAQAAGYRAFVVSKVKSMTAQKAGQFSWYAGRPDAGPGRLDTPNSLKRMLGVDITPDSVGTVDFPSVWNQKARANRYLHWDANSPSLTERDHITAAIAGATGDAVDQSELKWIETWLDTLPTPKYPFPIDRERATRGATVFERNCAGCHDQRPLEVTPIALVATDRHRLDALSADLVTRMNAFGGQPGGTATAHYRKTAGYSNVLLDGIWARAPYLHNGSVPTMLDLLGPADERPAVFFTGSSLYDPERMGFVSNGAGPDGGTFRFDTRLPGNGNGGHEFGKVLSEAEKRDLLEYLKTR